MVSIHTLPKLLQVAAVMLFLNKIQRPIPSSKPVVIKIFRLLYNEGIEFLRLLIVVVLIFTWRFRLREIILIVLII